MPGNGIRQLHGKTGSSISFPWELKEFVWKGAGCEVPPRSSQELPKSREFRAGVGKGRAGRAGARQHLGLTEMGLEVDVLLEIQLENLPGIPPPGFPLRAGVCCGRGGRERRRGRKGEGKGKGKRKEKERKRKGRSCHRLGPGRAQAAHSHPDFPPFPGKAAGAGLGSVVQRNPWEQEL